MTVGQVIAKLGVDPKEYEKGLRKAEAQANKAGSKIGSIFKNAFSVTIGVGMFEALKKGFKSTVGTAISFNSMLQTAQIGFATMLGSAEKAQKFLDDMADFAARTPFEYPELLDAAKRMLAYGFAAEEVLPTLRAVGDASAALGSGSVGIDRITLALGQIRAKGKLSAEEMRQLTEAGVPAWHILAEAMGKTVPELQDMVSKGLIPGHKAVEMLTKGMTQRFGGMMQSMENTWQGVTSSIKDIWRMTVGTLTQNLFGGLNAMLIKVRDFLQAFYTMLQSVMGKKAKQATDGLVQSTEDQAAAMTDVGDAAEEAAKKANKNLQAFDEFHELQNDMGDTDVGAFGEFDIGPVEPLGLGEDEESETITKMQEMFEKLKVLFDPVIDGFNRLKEAAGPVIQNIGDGLKWFYDNVLTPFGTWVIAEAVPAFFDLLANALIILNPVIQNIGEGLKWFYDNILVPFGSWVIAEAVPAFFDLLANALIILNPVLEAFKSLGQWLWDNFLQPIAAWSGQAFIDAMNFVTQAFRGLGDWMSKNKDMVISGLAGILAGILAYQLITKIPTIISSIGTALSGLGAAFGFLTSPIGLIIAAIALLVAGFVYFYKTNEGFRGLVDGVLNAIKDAAMFLWKNALEPLGEFLGKVFVAAWEGVIEAAGWLWENIFVPFGDFLLWFWESVLVPIGSILIDVLAIAFQTVADVALSFWQNVIIPLANFLYEVFIAAIEAVGAILSFLWNNILVPFGSFLIGIFKGIIEALINVFMFLWNNVLEPLAKFLAGVFVAVFDNLFRSIGTIIGGLKNIFVGLMNFITGVFTGNWEKAWEGVKKIFKGVFDSLWGIVKYPLNLIIDGLNFLLRGLNSISFDVPDWVPLIGGKSFGINIPLIPKLAVGTNYVPQDMLAYLHEGEAVVPKKYNPAAAGGGGDLGQVIKQAMLEALMQRDIIAGGSEGRELRVTMVLENGEVLADMLIDPINRTAKNRGYAPVFRPANTIA